MEGKKVELTANEAYLHMEYAVIPKVYSKTDRDKEALRMAMEGLRLLEICENAFGEVER